MEKLPSIAPNLFFAAAGFELNTLRSRVRAQYSYAAGFELNTQLTIFLQNVTMHNISILDYTLRQKTSVHNPLAARDIVSAPLGMLHNPLEMFCPFGHRFAAQDKSLGQIRKNMESSN